MKEKVKVFYEETAKVCGVDVKDILPKKKAVKKSK